MENYYYICLVKKSNIILLIGHPLCGKSTYIKKNYPTTRVISRDEIILDIYGGDDYNLAFSEVNQKQVDSELRRKLQESSQLNEDVIIDMTNITVKRRRKTLQYFNNYTKIAIVFPHLNEDEIIRRNQFRLITEKKSIPFGVIKNMILTYEKPTYDEGFDDIIFL